MNPNCNLCHGMGWYWVKDGQGGEFSRPCSECNPNVRTAWHNAGEQGRRVHKEFQAIEAARQPQIRYTQEWLGERLADSNNNGIAFIPCDECGNDVIEFSKPTDIANRVLHPDGDTTQTKYLCMHCFLNALRQELGIPKLNDPFRGQGDERSALS